MQRFTLAGSGQSGIGTCFLLGVPPQGDFPGREELKFFAAELGGTIQVTPYFEGVALEPSHWRRHGDGPLLVNLRNDLDHTGHFHILQCWAPQVAEQPGKRGPYKKVPAAPKQKKQTYDLSGTRVDPTHRNSTINTCSEDRIAAGQKDVFTKSSTQPAAGGGSREVPVGLAGHAFL